MVVSSGKNFIIPVDSSHPDWLVLRRVGAAIKRGKIVAIPTDTVYGLAVDPFNEIAVQQLFSIKKRPASNPILVLIESYQQVGLLAKNLPKSLDRIAARFWPGPLTIILPAKDTVPCSVSAGTGTIALRVPSSKVVRHLIRSSGCPLTGTSANLSGKRVAETAGEVYRQFGKQVHCILDGGRARSRQPSTILDLTGQRPSIVREGVLPSTTLEECLC